MQLEVTVPIEVGDAVLASDGRLGRIDRVVRSEARTPVYLVVSVGGSVRRRYPVIPCTLVEAVDRRRRRVRILGRRGALRRLPETLPLVL
jgi:hypothetical protein